jgi:hypothetical protein
MPRLKRFRINIIYVVGVEDAGTTAVEDCLFAWGVCEAETTPATINSIISIDPFTSSFQTSVIEDGLGTGKNDRGKKTYEGCLLGAQTIAILSGIIT